ncbi:MAG: serine hydrolase domain-containing protein [Niabella sp.]
MKNKLFILIHLLIINLIISPGLSAQTNEQRIKNIEAAFPVIDKMMTDFAKQHHSPGLAYGLVVDGQLVHSGNSGYANISENIKASSQSAFRIASMTKSFTGLAILKLRDEGKLKLDDPADLYIPELKNQKYLTADAAPITIRNLLTHTAGFPEDNAWGDRQLATTDEQLLTMVKKGFSFSNNPGTKMEYSNTGFALLGFIIKKVSGLSCQDYIIQNILQPLGMTHTYWEYDKVPAKELAHGYKWSNGQWQEEPLLHDGAYGPMGGLISTIEDFSKYMAFYLSAMPARNEKDNGPVKRGSLREMQYPWNFTEVYDKNKRTNGKPCPTAAGYNYGLRWIKDCENRVYVGHSGGLPGFGSNWNVMPDYGIGFVSFCNFTYAPMSAINTAILDTLIQIAKLTPRQLAVSDILHQRKNELLKILPDWKGATNATIFADNFFLDYSSDALRKEATEIFNKAGKIIKVGEIIPENNLRGSFIMEGENADIEIRFTLTPQNPALIQEYHIRERKKK